MSVFTGSTPPPPKGVPALVLIDASSSTDPNDQVVAYRAEIQPDNIVTEFQASPHFELTVPTAGQKLVSITVRDKFGLTASLTQDLTLIENLPPTVLARWGQTTSQAPFQVQLRATGSDPDDPANLLLYNFIFPDQTSSGFTLSPTVSKVFPTAGTYFVIVQVKDPGGLVAEVNVPVLVQNNLLPVAQFNIQPRNDYAPATLSFDASPSFDPDGPAETAALNFRWDFGDGQSAEGKTLQHTFVDPGEYAVRLFATDPRGGMGILGRIVFAWSSAPPTPRLSVTPSIGPIPLQVTFNAQASTPGDTPIARYVIITGDGNTLESTTPIIQHTYTTPNIYSATLKVYDQDGDGNLIAQSIRAFNGQKPIAFVEKLSEDVIIPASFTLTAVNSTSPNPSAQITTYNWTLPNGELRTGPTISFTTQIEGIQYVRLQVTDNYGIQSDPVNFPIAAATGLPPLAIVQSAKSRYRVGQTALFDGSSSWTPNGTAQIVEHKWFLPNGSVALGAQTQLLLSEPGNFTVGLEVTDSKGYKSPRANFPIIVEDIQPPTAVIQYALSSEYSPTILSLDGTQSQTPNLDAEIQGYEWRVDGPNGISIPAFGPTPSMHLHVVGEYAIHLRVFDTAGGTSPWVSVSGIEVRENQKPIARISLLQQTLILPDPILADAFTSSDPDGHMITQYHWSLSDGQTSQGAIANFNVALPGLYTLMLQVTDELGLTSDPVYRVIELRANQPPIAVPQVSLGTLFGQIHFDSSQSLDDEQVVSAKWIIDGSLQSEAPAGDYLFSSSGEKIIQLIVTDNRGLESSPAEVRIQIPEPQLLTHTINFENVNWANQTATIRAEFSNAVGVTIVDWRFEDGTSASGASTQASFTNLGYVSYGLTARDSSGKYLSTDGTAQVPAPQNAIALPIARAPDGRAATSGTVLVLDHFPITIALDGSDSIIPLNQPIRAVWKLDGQIVSESLVAHLTLEAPNSYGIELELIGANGSSSSTLQVEIPADSCNPSKYDDQISGCAWSPSQRLSQLPTSGQLTLQTNISTSNVDPAHLSVSFVSLNGEDPENPNPGYNFFENDVVQFGSNSLSLDLTKVYERVGTQNSPVTIYVKGHNIESQVPFEIAINEVAFKSSTVTAASLSDEFDEIVLESAYGDLLIKTSPMDLSSNNLPPGQYTVTAKNSLGVVSGYLDLQSNSTASIQRSNNEIPTSVALIQTEGNSSMLTATNFSTPDAPLVGPSENEGEQSTSMNSSSSATFSSYFRASYYQKPGMQASDLGGGSTKTHKGLAIGRIITAPAKLGDLSIRSTYLGEELEITCSGYAANWDRPALEALRPRVEEWRVLLSEGRALEAEKSGLDATLASFERRISLADSRCTSQFNDVYIACYQQNVEPIIQERDAFRESQYQPLIARVEEYQSRLTAFYSGRSQSALIEDERSIQIADGSKDVNYIVTVSELKTGPNGRKVSSVLMKKSVSLRELKGEYTPVLRRVGEYNYVQYHSNLNNLIDAAIEGSAEKKPIRFTIPEAIPGETILELKVEQATGNTPIQARSWETIDGKLVPTAPMRGIRCDFTSHTSTRTTQIRYWVPPYLGPSLRMAEVLNVDREDLLPCGDFAYCKHLRKHMATNSTGTLERGSQTADFREGRYAAQPSYLGFFPASIDTELDPIRRNSFGYRSRPTALQTKPASMSDAEFKLLDTSLTAKEYSLFISPVLDIGESVKRLKSMKLEVQSGSNAPVELRSYDFPHHSQQIPLSPRSHASTPIQWIISHSEIAQVLPESSLQSHHQSAAPPSDSPTEFDLILTLTGETKIGDQVAEFATTRTARFELLYNLRNLKVDAVANQFESLSLKDRVYGKNPSLYGNRRLARRVWTMLQEEARLCGENRTEVMAKRDCTSPNPNQPDAFLPGWGGIKFGDGTLPFGGDFDPHKTHKDGESMDFRTFGLTALGEDYSGFGGARRFNDLRTLTTYVFSVKVRSTQAMTIGECLEVSAVSGINCSEQFLIENRCLLAEPVAENDRNVCESQFPNEQSCDSDYSTCKARSAYLRLGKWSAANRIGIKKMRDVNPSSPPLIFGSAGIGWWTKLKSLLSYEVADREFGDDLESITPEQLQGIRARVESNLSFSNKVTSRETNFKGQVNTMLVIYGTLPNGLLLPRAINFNANAIQVPKELQTEGFVFDPNAPTIGDNDPNSQRWLIELSLKDEYHYGHHHLKNPLQPERRKR